MRFHPRAALGRGPWNRGRASYGAMGGWLGFQGPLAPLLPIQHWKGSSLVQSVIKSHVHN